MTTILKCTLSIPNNFLVFFGIGFGAGLILYFSISLLRRTRRKNKRLLIQTLGSEAIILKPHEQIFIGGKRCGVTLPELEKPVALASIIWSGRNRQKLILTILHGTVRIERRQVHQSAVYHLGEEIIFRYEHRSYHLQLIPVEGTP